MTELSRLRCVRSSMRCTRDKQRKSTSGQIVCSRNNHFVVVVVVVVGDKVFLISAMRQPDAEWNWHSRITRVSPQTLCRHSSPFCLQSFIQNEIRRAMQIAKQIFCNDKKTSKKRRTHTYTSAFNLQPSDNEPTTTFGRSKKEERKYIFARRSNRFWNDWRQSNELDKTKWTKSHRTRMRLFRFLTNWNSIAMKRRRNETNELRIT